MTNLGFALISDPLNYIPFGAAAKGAKTASLLAKVEKTAISRADDIFRAAAAGGTVAEEFVPIAMKRGELVQAMVGKMMTPEDVQFLNKWRIAGTLYDATIGKASGKFNALMGAIRTPVLIGMTRSLGNAPRTLIEGLSNAGAKEAASNFAESLGRGLMQTTVFTMSRLFSRGSMNLGRERALRAIKLVDEGLKGGSAVDDIGKRLLDDGLVGSQEGAAAFIDEVSKLDDAGRRAKVNEVAAAWSKANVARAGAESGGDYKHLMEVGGIRLKDTADEAAAHIAEGARKYEGLDEAVLENLFVEKAVTAAAGEGSTMVVRMISGAQPVGADNLEDIMRQIWKSHVGSLSKLGPEARKAELAKMVQLAEMAAYGRQGTNAAQIRAILVAAKSGDTAKLSQLSGVAVDAEKAAKIATILESEIGKKLTRINLVRSNSLTDERIQAILKLADEISAPASAADGAAAAADEVIGSIINGSADANKRLDFYLNSLLNPEKAARYKSPEYVDAVVDSIYNDIVKNDPDLFDAFNALTGESTGTYVEKLIAKRGLTGDAASKLRNASDDAKKAAIAQIEAKYPNLRERIAAHIKARSSGASAPRKGNAQLLESLPDDLRQAIASAQNVDELAVAVAGYFPDLHLLVGKSGTAIWEEMRQVLDNIVADGNTVKSASSEEIKALVDVLDEIAPGAGKNVVEQLSRGRYTIGFSPESGVISRPATRVTDEAVALVNEPNMPFVDSTADLANELSITTDTFARSSLRRAADRWLTPISSKVVEQQQIDTTIKLVTKNGGTEADARRLLSAIGELSLKKNMTPRALLIDETALRDVMQQALGKSYKQIVDTAGGGDPRRILMKMYAGSSDVVGATQYFTGFLKTKLPQLALITDFIYPTLKFKVNPNFYLQEMVESPFFNYLRAISRELTTGEYAVKNGWARIVPFARTRLGEKLGLSTMTGPQVEASVAALTLGGADSALRAELDVAEAVIFLQGRGATQILSSEGGKLINGGIAQMISGRAKEFLATMANPYPMKNQKRVEMALSLALEEVADKIRYEMPEQWVAMSKAFGTNNPRKVMIHLIQDSAAGWVNPVRVIDGARPRNFAFSGPGSIEAANAVKSEIDEIASMLLDTPQAIGNAKARIIALKESVRKSAETGNEVSRVMAQINKTFAEDLNVADSIAELKKVSDEAFQISTESVNDFKLINEAVAKHFESPLYRGFTREKIAGSLSKFRDYGLDLPGMESVVADLRLGKELSVDQVRALGYAMDSLLNIHGPEEMLLSALKGTVKDTSQTANRIHFYNPNRSAFERSLNHPYLAFYPLSYMVGKVVPEFARAAFVKFPFTNRTAPFAGYEIIREIQDHITVQSEADPKFKKMFEDVNKSDALFLMKQLFPGLPGDISVSGPKWINRTYAQLQRSSRPAVGNRPRATVDPGYAIRALAGQAKDQSVWGVAEQYGGAASEIWDFFLGPVDHKESNP